jgi:hypothetical protein
MEIDTSPRDWGDLEVGGRSAVDDDLPVLTQRGQPVQTNRLAGSAMGPEAVVLYKVFVIAVVSIGFAAIATWVIQRAFA